MKTSHELREKWAKAMGKPNGGTLAEFITNMDEDFAELLEKIRELEERHPDNCNCINCKIG